MSEKVVLHFQNGSILKGGLRDFSETANELSIEEHPSGNPSTVRIDQLKAVFFVKSFEGDPSYREIKRYEGSTEKGKKVFVRFKDKESLPGYLDGETPWEKGFFLSKSRDKKGFFLTPTDEGSNNIKIFVIATAVEDITLL